MFTLYLLAVLASIAAAVGGWLLLQPMPRALSALGRYPRIRDPDAPQADEARDHVQQRTGVDGS
jgi:hypothetical protein